MLLFFLYIGHVFERKILIEKRIGVLQRLIQLISLCRAAGPGSEV
ncbi:hypothetical protein [Paenibacillus sp. XY044]|nr:hypothetical protein [Paenibacillus sp. XY044]